MTENEQAAGEQPQAPEAGAEPVATSGPSSEEPKVNTAEENGPQDSPPAEATGEDPSPGGVTEPPESEANPGDPESGPDAEQEAEQPALQARDTLRVTVTAFSQTKGVELNVNGRAFLFPIGKPVDVPGWVLPSLAAVGGAKFTVESP